MTVILSWPSAAIAELTLSRQNKRNALNIETMKALQLAAEDVTASKDVRCVILSGDGPVFSAGADVKELASLGLADAHQFIDQLRAAIEAVFQIPVPVICRIEGACIGGAMELAAACDLRIAHENATFCMPEVHVGIPSVIQAALLPRIMGYTRASWTVLSGEVLSAEKALQWGFVDDVVTGADIEAAVSNACDQVTSAAPKAVRAQKQLVRDWLSKPLDVAIHDSMDTFAASYETSEPSEYLRTQLAKRSTK